MRVSMCEFHTVPLFGIRASLKLFETQLKKSLMLMTKNSHLEDLCTPIFLQFESCREPIFYRSRSVHAVSLVQDYERS